MAYARQDDKRNRGRMEFFNPIASRNTMVRMAGSRHGFSEPILASGRGAV